MGVIPLMDPSRRGVHEFEMGLKHSSPSIWTQFALMGEEQEAIEMSDEMVTPLVPLATAILVPALMPKLSKLLGAIPLIVFTRWGKHESAIGEVHTPCPEMSVATTIPFVVEVMATFEPALIPKLSKLLGAIPLIVLTRCGVQESAIGEVQVVPEMSVAIEIPFVVGVMATFEPALMPKLSAPLGLIPLIVLTRAGAHESAIGDVQVAPEMLSAGTHEEDTGDVHTPCPEMSVAIVIPLVVDVMATFDPALMPKLRDVLFG